jgi:hypothetical protein
MHALTSYTGQRVAFLNQHGKEAVVVPVLEPALGCRVERVSGFDTDRLGTFSREIARPSSQLETARLKARTGMTLAGCPLGLGSEGAFGPDPFSGLMPWNVELLVWLDDTLNLEVVGLAQGPGHCHQERVNDLDGLRRIAERAGFPSHHLMLRPDHEAAEPVIKGVADWPALLQAFEALMQRSQHGRVFVESDLRAYSSPSRQAMIRRAAQDLAQKLQSHCPACSLPGFSVVRQRPGLPCRDCLLPTRMPLADVWACGACGHEREVPRQQAGDAMGFADPGRCDHCNP